MMRLCLAALCGLFCLAPVGGQTPDSQYDVDSARYVMSCQIKAGGFAAAKPHAAGASTASLRATTAAVRALKYLWPALPYAKASCVTFVESCYDPISGGFADAPRGKPDVASTAVGAMAVAELDMSIKKYEMGIREYLGNHAKSFEDIRIAVAALESIHAISNRQDEWLEQVVRKRNPDGTWGQGTGAARDTSSAIVAVLRMKGPVVNRDHVLKTLREGQRRDGGFGSADTDNSDLETTYRVIRAFVMLKARPADVDGVRSFVAKCRNDDHGFGVQPQRPSSVGATYYATIIREWLAKD